MTIKHIHDKERGILHYYSEENRQKGTHQMKMHSDRSRQMSTDALIGWNEILQTTHLIRDYQSMYCTYIHKITLIDIKQNQKINKGLKWRVLMKRNKNQALWHGF